MAGPPYPNPVGRTSPLRVLLVEDSSVYVLRTEVSLAESAGQGLSLISQGTLEGATAEIRAGNIDCVLLDLGLPDAQDLEALTRVQQVDPRLPVVVLSAEESQALAVQAVHEGAQDFLMKANATGDVLLRSIGYAIQRKKRELELTRQAFSDSLTGLPNRELFLDRLAVALARAERTGHLVGVMFVDLNRFKKVNDTLGHEAGDIVLRELARRLTQALRPSDAVARCGGDEFLLLCDALDDEAQASVIAERVQLTLAEPVMIEGRPVYVGASIGVAFGRDRTTPPDSLIRAADDAMYRDKRQGRSRVIAEPPRP